MANPINRSILMDKVSFVQKLAMLAKATSDDESPTAGYLFQELNGLTYDSGSYCHDLLDYLVDRLEDPSHKVKFKVLTLMKHLVENGHQEFRNGLRKKSKGIKDASGFSGPSDPHYGNTPYVNVRTLAKELSEVLFDLDSETVEEEVEIKPNEVTSPNISYSTGMGSSYNAGKLQGFGNVPQSTKKSLSDTIVGGIMDFAGGEKMIPSFTMPQSEYEPVQLETEKLKLHPFQKMEAINRRPKPKERKRGVPGGGWDDDDPEELNVSSDLSSSSTDQSDRLASLTLNDWTQEQELLNDFVNDKATPIPTRNEINQFIKRCSDLNCDKIVEFLNCKLMEENLNNIMRALIFLDQMMRSDLASVDTLALACHKNLAQIKSKSTEKCIVAKSRKFIKHLELLSQHGHLFTDEQQITASSENGICRSKELENESLSFDPS